MKLRVKFLLLFLGITAILMLVGSFAGYTWLKGQTEKTIQGEMEALTLSHVNQLQLWATGKAKVIQTMAALVEANNAEDPSIPKSYLRQYLKDSDLTDVYVGYMDGSYLDGGDWIPPADWDARTRPWFQAAVQHNGLAFTEPYIDAISKKYVVTAAVPVKNAQGTVRAVIGEDMLLTTIIDKFKNAKIRGEGYVILLDAQGQTLSHPNENLLGKNLADDQTFKELAKTMTSVEKGRMVLPVDGQKMLVTYQRVPSTNWNLALLVPENVVYQELTILKFIPLFGIVVVIVLLLFFARLVSRPIENLQQLMEKVEQGDLTVRGTVESRDEIGLLTRAINRTLDKLQYLINDSNNKVNYLNAIPSPVIVMDKDSNIVFVNPAAAQIIKQQPADCIGKKCYQLFGTDVCCTKDCGATRALTDNTVVTTDSILHTSGENIPVRFTVTPLRDDSGQIAGVLKFMIDIREEHEAVATVNQLVQKALAGDISLRGTPDNFHIIGFKKTIQGINDLLDTVHRPIQELSLVLKELACGNLTVQMTGEYQGIYADLKNSINMSVTAVGQMIRDIHVAMAELGEASQKLTSIATTVAANSEEMNAKTCTVSTTVEQISASISHSVDDTVAISKNINDIALAAEEVSSAGKSSVVVSETAAEQVRKATRAMEEISASITRMADSTRDVSSSVDSVAEAVKEINVSLQRVNENCERSTDITEDARQRSQQTNDIIAKLSDSSKNIGKIVNIISNITERTNMLALNATIEAACAGEAGKGFAVVAGEVKELAKRTAEATMQIGQQIEDMQKDMSAAVRAVEKITDVIRETTSITKTIATAVTEQSHSVNGISSAVAVAAKQVTLSSKEMQDIAGNSKNASQYAVEAADGMKEIVQAAMHVSTKSVDMAANTDRISKVMSNMVNTIQEISAGSHEISLSIQEMDAASNDTATRATETSMAAAELVDTADKLSSLVNKFQV